MKFYNEAGHICPITKRIAIPATDYAKSKLNGAASVFIYQKDPDKVKNDPWKVVESIKYEPEEDSADIQFNDGCAKHVRALRNIVVYIPNNEQIIEQYTTI